MSVAVMIQLAAPDRAPLYLPLATEAAFSHAFLPAARRLGLRWFPLFETGITVPLADLPEVLAEAAALRAELASREDTAPWAARLGAVLAAFADLDWAEVREVYIG